MPEFPERQNYIESAIERFKFPRIKHVFDESGRTRDDLLATPEERDEFLEQFNGGRGVLTEKIDGLNIGIGFTSNGELRLRHRNDLVTDGSNKIYTGISKWATSRADFFHDLLKSDSILFVEWMEWQHTTEYDDLSDFAQAISLYDAKEKKLMSHKYITELLDGSGISVVPTVSINKPVYTAQDCLQHISQSNFSTTSKMEGLILRIDDGVYNKNIMKFVHPDFRGAVDDAQHWLTQELKRNTINHLKQAKLLNR